MGYSALVILSGNASSGIDQWNLRLKDFISVLKVGNLNIAVLSHVNFDSTTKSAWCYSESAPSLLNSLSSCNSSKSSGWNSGTTSSGAATV